MTGTWQAFCGISRTPTSTRFLTKEAAQIAIDRHVFRDCPGPHAVNAWPSSTAFAIAIDTVTPNPGSPEAYEEALRRCKHLEAWVATLTRQRDEAISRRAGVLGRDDGETTPAVPDTPASLRVFNTIFNALSTSIVPTTFMALSERMRVTADIYDALRESGVEIRMEGSGDD